jgi:Site-specific recombinase XerD
MLINIEEYRSYLVRTEKSENTIKSYLNILNQFIDFTESYGIKEVTIEDVLSFKKYLMSKKYTIATLNQKIISICVYFNYVGRSDLKIKTEKIQNKSYKEFLNKEQYFELLTHCLDNELKLFMITIACTGLRISETVALKKSDLGLKVIVIRNKGKNRVIGLPQELKEQLQKIGNDEYIFIKSQSSYRNRLKTLARQTGIDEKLVYPHAFRHFFAKQFLDVNGGEKVLVKLQRILGHSSLETTMIYLQYSDEDIAEEMESFSIAA